MEPWGKQRAGDVVQVYFKRGVKPLFKETQNNMSMLEWSERSKRKRCGLTLEQVTGGPIWKG